MANTQINVTENGTKTLATAGKYCDRNIDVNVNVSGKATQFTNLYDPANVTLQHYITASSSADPTYTAEGRTNYVKIPYHHKAGAPVVLRIRGIGTVRDRNTFVVFESDGTTKVNHYAFGNSSYITHTYDEYGDAMLTFKSTLVSSEWYYLVFNFQYIGINTGVTTAHSGPIITINEPIGNGGCAT